MDIHIAFEQRVHIVVLDQILPSKMLTAAVAESAKYKRIAASLKEVGLVEPLVISRIRGGGFTLLDGHVRLSILKEQGALDARCIIADDDEAFTYNKRVNRLAVIQEHYMIVRAIDRGVSEEKLAAALSVDVLAIWSAPFEVIHPLCWSADRNGWSQGWPGSVTSPKRSSPSCARSKC